MKKWIVIFMVVGSMSFLHHEVDALAQTKQINTSLVKALKKGKLPSIPVKVGNKASTVQKKVKGQFVHPGDFVLYEATNGDTYMFTDVLFGEKVAKVATISRMYDYKITKRSIEKHFGKPYKGYNERNQKVNTYIYKTGTYYTHIRSYKDGSTNVMVGTKKSVSAMKGVKKLSKQ